MLGREPLVENGVDMNGKVATSSDRLFAVPTFWSGMARALDLGGTFDAYRGVAAGQLADEEALRADWLTVGQDMENAIQAGK